MPSQEEVWNVAETILLEEEEILIPISKLLYLINEEKNTWNLDLATLRKYLEARPLFLLYDFPEESNLWPDSENELMAKKGFFKGDKVMILDKKPSAEDMREIILGNLDHLYRSLADTLSISDLEMNERESYLQSMQRAKELYEKFSNLIIEDEENG